MSVGSIGAIDHRPQVILIRGFQDWYSMGIDELNEELRAKGVPTKVYREEQWKDVAEGLLGERSEPIVLVGFSYGADDVILIARRLEERRLIVKLLITIDPVTPDRVPVNVMRCVNFYQPNGFWDLFPWLRGVPVEGESKNPAAVENINVRRRLDLVEPDTSHATIAANRKIHRQIVEMVVLESLSWQAGAKAR